MAHVMRLLFDHGTLVLAEAPELNVDRVPGLRWDARVALFRAPACCYTEVVAALRRSACPLRDEVAPSGLPRPAIWRPISLRPYQQAALLSWELCGRRGTIALPTGSGKTQVALAALASRGARALCLVPTRALLAQWTAAIRAAYTGPIGCLGDGHHAVAAVTVSTYESAYRHMPRLGAQFELLVVDEAHHVGAGLRAEALEMSIAGERLGLTATPPVEAASSPLSELIGPVVYQLGIGDLAGTWLAGFDLLLLHLGLTPDERSSYDEDQRVFRHVHRPFRRSDPEAS